MEQPISDATFDHLQDDGRHRYQVEDLIGRGGIGRSGADGYFGFPTPPDAASESLVLSVHAEGFNARHLRLDGTSRVLDLGALLYGPGGALGG